jgi:hypothetical protein
LVSSHCIWFVCIRFNIVWIFQCPPGYLPGVRNPFLPQHCRA